MADEKTDGTLWKWPSVVAMAALVGGLYLKQTPLHSARSGDKATLEHASVGDQTVEARLWQDPLEAVHAHLKENAGKGATNSTAGSNDSVDSTVSELANQIHRRFLAGASNITVFLKLVPGGRYAEDIEVRLRARYAVLSGLSVADYVPCDEEHLGYFEVPWPRGADLEHYTNGTVLALTNYSAARPLLVPFEWFQPSQLRGLDTKDSSHSAQAVLLLWLPAEDFDDHPCKRLAQLKHALDNAVHSDCGHHGHGHGSPKESLTHHAGLSFKLFDPRLLPMVNEIRKEQQSGDDCSTNDIEVAVELKGMEVYSAWSTTADALLVPEGVERTDYTATNPVTVHVSDEVRPREVPHTNTEPAFERRGTARELLSRRGLHLVNVTCTDFDLAGALIDELALRGVDMTRPTEGVVVLSEWDTYYGRALPLTLATEVRARTAQHHITLECLENRTEIANKLQKRPEQEPFFRRLYERLSTKTRRLLDERLANAAPSPQFAECLAQDLDRLIHEDFLRHDEAFKDLTQPSDVAALMQSQPTGEKLVHLNRLLLSKAFDSCLADCRWDKVAEKLGKDTEKWPENLIRATYFRGVDGLLPGESMPKGRPSKGHEKEEEAEAVPRAFGRSQLDYIPRLAQHILELDLKAKSRGRTIKAIGVLGSDVYDKLLLLQALHDLFPNVIFFTTDFDARLCYVEELKSTRNLIIASSFDLGLSRETRGSIPPFRDSFQTAQFLSTRAALEEEPKEWLKYLKPRLFEISRNGPYDLAPPRPLSALDASNGPIYPTRPSRWPGLAGLGMALLAVAFGVVLLVGHSDTLSDIFRGKQGLQSMEKRLYLVLGISGFGLSLLLAWVIWINHFHENGEPFSLLSGISLWPTEILRLIALLASGAFIIKATYDLKRNDAELEKEFELGEPESSEDPRPFGQRSRHFLEALFSWKAFRDRPVVSSMQAPAGATVNASELWNEYKEFGRAPNRCRRYLFAAFVYAVFAWLVTKAFGEPFRPYRGQLCFWTDQLLMYLSVGAMFVLLFFVVDATLLCRRFVKLLAGRPSQYPPEALQPHAKRRGLDGKYLDEWLDMRLIARRTGVVGQFIYYPFIVLALMIVAHNSFFDHWQWPLSLLLVFGGLLAYVFYGAVALRCEAARARRQELERIRDEYLAENAQGHKDVAERIQRLIDEINATEEGAFAPLAQHPVLRVLALPFGSAGLLTGLDFLALR